MTNKKELTEEQIQRYRSRCRKYVAGKGRINPKWLDLPDIDKSWLWTRHYDKLDKKLKVLLYPFKRNVSSEIKFRILVVERFACILAGYDESHDHVRALSEWIRMLLLDDESNALRRKLRIPGVDELVDEIKGTS